MKKNEHIIFYVLLTISLLWAKNPDNWAQEAIWYQIFPERFYNGDTSNDPTIHSLWGVWPWEKQAQWQISPWTSDWYKMQPWEQANGKDFDYQFQLRRYGGDIQGILDKLDYLQQLGINAIYLNPVFDSPSSHKYGAAMYRHIDRHFGPDPIGDTKIIESENPHDPQTWRWTSADKLFLDLIQEVHQRGMHIIIDGVFNHVGLTFWAFQDVIKNRANSLYFRWFNIAGSGLPDKSHLNEYKDLPAAFIPENCEPMRYTGYVEDLPAFRQDEYGPVQPVREHLFNIVKRWMDPNNDGNPEDGIDGWRLDVAERLQIKFWDAFGKFVREINQNAYITGEVWWEDYWENKQFDASPWLQDGRFDAVMNYKFGNAMFQFFIDQEQQIKPSELKIQIDKMINQYGSEKLHVLQNVLDSHDMERLASAIVNPDRWMDHANNLRWNPEFDIRKPNPLEYNILKTIVAFQFTFIGAPYIYYGDEVGMWGADDPDCRKPMLWDEFKYENESTHPCKIWENCNYTRPVDVVQVNNDILDFYKSMTELRKKYPVLSKGTFKTIYTNDSTGVFSFIRELDNQKIIATFNSSSQEQMLPKQILPNCSDNWKLISGSVENGKLKSKSYAIFVRNQ